MEDYIFMQIVEDAWWVSSTPFHKDVAVSTHTDAECGVEDPAYTGGNDAS